MTDEQEALWRTKSMEVGDNTSLKPMEKLFLIIYWMDIIEDGGKAPGTSRLARECSLSERSILRIRKVLKAKGLLPQHAQGAKKGVA